MASDHSVGEAVAVVGMDRPGPAVVPSLRGSEPRQLAPALVDEPAGAVGVGLEDSHRGALGQHTLVPLALDQLRLQLDAVVDFGVEYTPGDDPKRQESHASFIDRLGSDADGEYY